MAKNYIKAIHKGKSYKYHVKSKRFGFFDFVEVSEVEIGSQENAREQDTRLIYYKQYESKTNSTRETYGDHTFADISFSPDNIKGNRCAFESFIKTCEDRKHPEIDGTDIKHHLINTIIPMFLNG